MSPVEECLRRNDLVYDILPFRWIFGLPIGNGELGGMVWVEDETRLVLTLDSIWAWDHRKSPAKDPDVMNHKAVKDLILKEILDEDWKDFPAKKALQALRSDNREQILPAKTHVGRLVVDFEEKISGTARLNLLKAEADLEIGTETGNLARIRIVALANLPAIMVECEGSAAVREIRLERVSPDTLKGSRKHSEQRDLQIPDWYELPMYERGKTEEISWIRQEIPASPPLALALLPGVKRSYVTVCVSRDGGDPVADAAQILEKASADIESFLDDHYSWWHRFWNKSTIQLPDAQIECLWYMGLYLLASSSRDGGAAVSLHGLWQPDGRMPPQMGFYIWDFYPQYWGIHGANHLELGDGYYGHLLSLMPRFKEDTRSFYGWAGAFVPGFMSIDGSKIVGLYPPVLIWGGTSAWASQLFWWHYLYSRDVEFLREKAYPFMRECALFYEGLLERGADGKYHIYPTSCPEWGGFGDRYWGRDDTPSLALIRGLIEALLQAVEVLELDEPHRHHWREMCEALPAYHADESGFCLMEEMPYSHPSGHLSHLTPIYPCGDVNIDGSKADRELIENSVDNLVEKGFSTWQGWAFVWASLIASRVGRGQMAYWTLKQFAEAFVSCNTFNLNGDWKSNGLGRNSIAGSGSFVFSYCQDGNMAAVAAANEMLLQSWGGRIRIFPGCPSHWRTVRCYVARPKSA